jgi:glycosyltransferase involved in cell wall biosynthesis
MVDSLVSMGFRVELRDYKDLVIKTKSPDFFIGHNSSFHILAHRFSSSCQKILITTGCSPQHDRASVDKRSKYFFARHGIEFPFKHVEDEHVEKNGLAADHVYMMGSDFTVSTWPKSYREKSTTYHNIVNFSPLIKTGRSGGFLYMSNHGCIRRGLDLVLDVFLEINLPLYICGPLELEKNFYKFYQPLLSQKKNINYCGYIDTSSNQFRKIIKDCDFVVLPSCSEAESGSVLNAMSLGLLPIVTKEVGFTDVSTYGYFISNDDVQSIRDLILHTANSSDEVIAEKRLKLSTHLEDFTPEAFANQFADFITRSFI